MELTKIDIARRQLATAIRLFFERGDCVSIFSLATNSWEIVDAICNLRGVDSVSNESRLHIPDDTKDLKRNYINLPFRNFFKHADRDPNSVVTGFDDTKCDPILFLATEDYLRLVGKSPIELQIFQLWYLAMYPEKVAQDALDRVLEQIESMFPNIRSLNRDQQILLGHDVLEAARSDVELHRHPGTEPVF